MSVLYEKRLLRSLAQLYILTGSSSRWSGLFNIGLEDGSSTLMGYFLFLHKVGSSEIMVWWSGGV